MSQVWIASHIHSWSRYKWLKEAIMSIENQSTPTKLFLSWSKESFITADIEDFLINLNLVYSIKFHPTRKRQFDHIRYISEHVTDDNTYIFFCDDDDYYHSDRIKTILSCGNYEVFVDNSIIVDSKSNIVDIDGISDFANYVVKVDIVKKILNDIDWSKISDNLYKTADVLFTSMLTKYYIKNINSSLYYRRQDPFDQSYSRAWLKDMDFEFPFAY